MKPLVVIPTYMSKDQDVEVTGDCVASIRQTVSDTVDILCVDDGSPKPDLVTRLGEEYKKYDFEVHRKGVNEGFSRTVNVGLRKAREEGREAVLMNADMEMSTPGWVKRARQTKDPEGRPAAVVGAMLLYPSGLIQHAGIYFSLLTRTFDHMYKYGPQNLPEACAKDAVPVTGAFQFIRPETLEVVGLYDEQFRMGWEDVDFCIRVFNAKLNCVYNPDIRAFHYEQMFRGRKDPKVEMWQAHSFSYLCQKHAEQSFAGLVPFW